MVKSVRRLEDVALIVLFLGVLFGSWADMAVGIDPTPQPTEHRMLFAWPPWPTSPGEVRGFARGVAEYSYDHFGFRRFLLAVNRDVRLALGESPTSQVVLGREGWLFYTGNECLDDHLGLYLLSPSDLDVWRATLARRHAQAAASGGRYLFVVAPAKMSIYPEFLPSWFSSAGPSTLHQIQAHLGAGVSAYFATLVPEFTAAKREEDTYYRTDTHWTPGGIQVADRTVADRLGLPVLGPVEVHKWIVNQRGGGLSRMMNSPSTFVEPIERSSPAGIDWSGEPFPLRWMSSALGIEVHVTAERFTGAGTTDALMFGDSFGRDLAPYLARRFATLTFVPMHPDVETFDVLRARLPATVVIEERTERYLKYPPLPHPRPDRALGWWAIE